MFCVVVLPLLHIIEYGITPPLTFKSAVPSETSIHEGGVLLALAVITEGSVIVTKVDFTQLLISDIVHV